MFSGGVFRVEVGFVGLDLGGFIVFIIEMRLLLISVFIIEMQLVFVGDVFFIN